MSHAAVKRVVRARLVRLADGHEGGACPLRDVGQRVERSPNTLIIGGKARRSVQEQSEQLRRRFFAPLRACPAGTEE